MTLSINDGALSRARRTVVRSALVWVPLFVLFVALAVYLLVRTLTVSDGAWVGFVIAGLMALLTSSQVFPALRDLRAEPIETEGMITHKGSKADTLIFRRHYATVGKRVFPVRKDVWELMPGVSERIYLRHLPHTNTLIAWEARAISPIAADPSVSGASLDVRPIGPDFSWIATPESARISRSLSGMSKPSEIPSPRVQPHSFGAPRVVRRPPERSSGDQTVQL